MRRRFIRALARALSRASARRSTGTNREVHDDLMRFLAENPARYESDSPEYIRYHTNNQHGR